MDPETEKTLKEIDRLLQLPNITKVLKGRLKAWRRRIHYQIARS